MIVGSFMKFRLSLAGLCLLPLAAQTAPQIAPATTPAPACTAQGPIDNWNAAAQLIAGMGNAAYAGAMTDEQKASWTDYSKTAAADWNRLKRRYVDRISAWRGKYLQRAPATNTAFYPFSGPDATNALAFFPTRPNMFWLAWSLPAASPPRRRTSRPNTGRHSAKAGKPRLPWASSKLRTWSATWLKAPPVASCPCSCS